MLRRVSSICFFIVFLWKQSIVTHIFTPFTVRTGHKSTKKNDSHHKSEYLRKQWIKSWIRIHRKKRNSNHESESVEENVIRITNPNPFGKKGFLITKLKKIHDSNFLIFSNSSNERRFRKIIVPREINRMEDVGISKEFLQFLQQTILIRRKNAKIDECWLLLTRNKKVWGCKKNNKKVFMIRTL